MAVPQSVVSLANAISTFGCFGTADPERCATDQVLVFVDASALSSNLALPQPDDRGSRRLHDGQGDASQSVVGGECCEEGVDRFTVERHVRRAAFDGEKRCRCGLRMPGGADDQSRSRHENRSFQPVTSRRGVGATLGAAENLWLTFSEVDVRPRLR